ncbi:MAG: VCBS repeat-containing protein [Archangium sp.]
MILSLVLAAASSTSLERAALEVSRNVVDAGFEAPVGVYVEGANAPVNRAVGSLVMARLAEQRQAPVPVAARDATEAEKLAREQGLGSLVRLTVALEAPKLVVRGDALSTHVNFWSGVTPTRTGPAVALLASVDADLEALTMAGTAPTPQPARPLEVLPGVLARTAQVPAALTVFDVDGDHRGEVIALVGETIFTWSGDGKLRSRSELTGASSTRPTRDAFGFLAVNGGRLTAWSSRRDKPETFTWLREGWRSAGPADALIDGTVTLTPRPGLASFQSEFLWAGKNVKWPEALSQVSQMGSLLLGVSPNGSASVARGQAPGAQVSGVGSGSTLVDFDGDGSPELVVTTARSTGELDEMRVVSLGAFESAQARGGSVNEAPAAWQRKLEGRAVTATRGDLDGDGAEEAVLGVWREDGTGELVVLRRVQ